MRQLQTTTLSNQDISSYLLVSTYIATSDMAISFRIILDQIAGNGDYSFYATIKQLGVGTEYTINPIITNSIPVGQTQTAYTSQMISVNNTDVIKLYVKGLGADTTTPDITVKWFEIYDNTLTLSAIPSAVWNFVRRNLTVNATTTAIPDNQIDCVRGDTLTYTFTGLDLINYTKVYFTVKKNYQDLDNCSIIQVNNTTGLLYLNGLPTTSTPTYANLAVDSLNGTVVLTLESSLTKKLIYNQNNYVYDLEIIKNTNVSTPETGGFVVVRDVTLAVS